MTVRTFTLERDTGTVADGIVFPDGETVIRWRGDRPSTDVWPSLEDVEAIHGNGTTRVVFTPALPPPVVENPAVTIVASDVYGAHDATPRGVPDGYSWKHDADTDPAVDSLTFKAYQAINVWGQVFAPEGATTYAGNVQIRDPRVWFLVSDKWVPAAPTPGNLEGAYYPGDFQSGSVTARPRTVDGVWSIPLSGLNGEADAAHFWWAGMFPRIAIPTGAQGILVAQDMRVTGGANVIASTGADLFATPRTIVHSQGWNPGIPNPRMKRVTAAWQPFYATTVSLATLTSSPPPI